MLRGTYQQCDHAWSIARSPGIRAVCAHATARQAAGAPRHAGVSDTTHHARRIASGSAARCIADRQQLAPLPLPSHTAAYAPAQFRRTPHLSRPRTALQGTQPQPHQCHRAASEKALLPPPSQHIRTVATLRHCHAWHCTRAAVPATARAAAADGAPFPLQCSRRSTTISSSVVAMCSSYS